MIWCQKLRGVPILIFQGNARKRAKPSKWILMNLKYPNIPLLWRNLQHFYKTMTDIKIKGGIHGQGQV